MTSNKQFCTFYLGDLFMGVDVLQVQEVIRYQEMTPVPLAPDTIEGLINLRGQIVTAIDLRRRVGLPEREEDQELPTNIVLTTDDGAPVSLLVDEVGDVLEIDEDLFEMPPENLVESAREMVRGVFKLEDNLMLQIDPVKVMAISGGNDV